jgi:hypothetical protein
MPDALSWVDDVLAGSTKPWRVADVDDVDDTGDERQYIVKHFRAGDLAARVTEFICGSVAADLDPFTLRPVLVTFTPAFLASLERLPKQPIGLAGAVPGLHVAYPWLMHAVRLFDHPNALTGLKIPHQVGDIIGCDVLLQNLDRGDDNVLVDPASQHRKPAHVLHAIDWESGIAGASLAASGLPQLGALPKALLHGTSALLKERLSSVQDFDHILQELARWHKSSAARAQMLVQGVPSEWGVSSADLQAIATYLLARVSTTMLRLGQLDDPDKVFPNWQYAASF